MAEATSDAVPGDAIPGDAPRGIPNDVSADYENTAVREALVALQETPDYAHLTEFLLSLRTGYLIADVTGSAKLANASSHTNANAHTNTHAKPKSKQSKKAQKKLATRARTIRSTTGQLVLPLFTSMAQLRAVVTDVKHDELKGAMMPAREALGLITTDRFAAAEIDKAAPHSLVVLRKYVSLAAGDDPITTETLEGMR